jgi:hypothetical protein
MNAAVSASVGLRSTVLPMRVDGATFVKLRSLPSLPGLAIGKKMDGAICFRVLFRRTIANALPSGAGDSSET